MCETCNDKKEDKTAAAVTAMTSLANNGSYQMTPHQLQEERAWRGYVHKGPGWYTGLGSEGGITLLVQETDLLVDPHGGKMVNKKTALPVFQVTMWNKVNPMEVMKVLLGQLVVFPRPKPPVDNGPQT